MPKMKPIPKQSVRELLMKSEDIIMDLHTLDHALSASGEYVEDVGPTMNLDVVRSMSVLAAAALAVLKHYSMKLWLAQQETDIRETLQKRMLAGAGDDEMPAPERPASGRKRVRL